MQARSGTSFRLRWDEIGTGPYDAPASGTIDFKHTDAGLVNLNYQSTQPPPQFPILCASATECGNSLAGSYYMLIWGTRSPTLARAAAPGHPLERARRRGQRRRLEQPLPRAGARDRPGVPGGHPGGQDRVRGDAGRRDRRPVRQRRAHRPLGPGRRAGPDRLPPRGRRGQPLRAAAHEPRAAAAAVRREPAPAQQGRDRHLPLAQQPPHEGLVAPAVRRRRGRQQLRARRRQEPVGADQAGGRVHVLDPAERRDAPVGGHARRDAGALPQARAARRGHRRPAPLLHPVRPDGLRLQPRRPRLHRAGGELAQLARQPRLQDLRGHGRLAGARAAHACGRRPGGSPRSSSARRCGSAATASGAARARAGSCRARGS